MYTKPAIGMLLAFAGAITLAYGALQLLLDSAVVNGPFIAAGIASVLAIAVGGYFLIQAERAH